MILEYIRLFRGLNRLQHAAIFLTTFALPVSFEVVPNVFLTGVCLSCVNGGEFALYVVWYQIAMVVIALSTRADRIRLEEDLARISSELKDRINKCEEDNQLALKGINDRTSDINWWVGALRESLEEHLGIKLPGPRISVRVDPIGYSYSVQMAKPSVTPSPYLMVRLRSSIRRQGSRFRKWFLKWIWNLRYN